MKIDTSNNKNMTMFKDLFEGDCFALPNWSDENVSYCLKLFADSRVFDGVSTAADLSTGDVYILKEDTAVIPLPNAVLKF